MEGRGRTSNAHIGRRRERGQRGWWGVFLSVDGNLRRREIEATLRAEQSRDGRSLGVGQRNSISARLIFAVVVVHFSSSEMPTFGRYWRGAGVAMKHHVCPNFEAAS